jgi:outer membrane cobalamin receptor
MVRWLGILFDAAVTVRYVGQQYEDDLNTLSLGGYFVMDAIISRAITRNVELYAAAENISDRVYTTGRTTDGVISIGQPFMFRGGVRLRF